jgi:hypothetical protein
MQIVLRAGDTRQPPPWLATTRPYLLPTASHSIQSKKKKPLDFSRGFCITGMSVEIRTCEH